MCGIAGIAGQGGVCASDASRVSQAVALLHHRGPDGVGFHPGEAAPGGRIPDLVMGMRRLSIIDLEHGWQPLFNEDRSLALVANGEIYNHVELRQMLEARGHVFGSGSDCEVILHLYEEHGSRCVEHLQGMFAFALWDTRRRRLLLARDRLGEKPLYLVSERRKLWFASELRSLVGSGIVDLHLDPGRIHEYLHFGWVNEPATIIRGVTKLPPGHLLELDVPSWTFRTTCYWKLEESPVVEGDPVQRLRDQLEETGRRIIRADVPVSVALSGGFDSSLVAALAARHSARPVRAITVGYEQSAAQDERKLARRFASSLGMPFTECVVRVRDMVDYFPTLCLRRDDPIADLAGHGYHAISALSRELGCPVMLQGHGADELLWGYPWAVEAARQSEVLRSGRAPSPLGALWRQRPRALARTEFVRFAYLLQGALQGSHALAARRAHGDSRLVSYEISSSYQKGASAADTTYTPDFARQVCGSVAAAPHGPFAVAGTRDEVDIQVIAAQVRGYLLQVGLAQGDRLAMSNSVELRMPLVDYRLVETLVGIQKKYPQRERGPKQLLHEAAREWVPDFVVNRPKRGFTPPTRDWLQALRNRYADDLVEGRLRSAGILAREAAIRMTSDSSRFSALNDMLLKYLVLECWLRGFADASRRGPAAVDARASLSLVPVP